MIEKYESNMLIAEFMELKPTKQVMNSNRMYYKINDYQRHDSLIAHSEEFEYHLSWDWLMPVIEKIERQGVIVEIWLCLAKSCRITTAGFKKPTIRVSNTESNSTIEAVYDAVIEYIKWYNQNK